MTNRRLGEWRDEGACKSTDPELFFPPKGRRDLAKKAKAICFECPVRQECLDYAILHERDGIWGGEAPSVRAKLRQSQGLSLGLKAAREGWLGPETLLPPEDDESIRELRYQPTRQKERVPSHPALEVLLTEWEVSFDFLHEDAQDQQENDEPMTLIDLDALA